MIQKLFFYLFAGLLCPLLLPAQNTVFAPVGATWRYNLNIESISPPYGSQQYQYVVTKDTTMNGWEARKVQCELWENGAFSPYPLLNRYVATAGDKVYHWVDTSFVLLFDFGAAPGDTIFSAINSLMVETFSNPGYLLPWMQRTDFSYVIDSLGTMQVDGTTLRTQYVHSTADILEVPWQILGVPQLLNQPLIERIGSYPSGSWYGSGLIVLPPEGPLSSMRCYRDADIYFEGNTLGIPCDSVVATHAPFLPGFSIGPNPFMEELKLVVPAHSYPDLQFTLYHYSGQEISRSALRQGDYVLHTGPLPAGVYFWEIRSGARLLGNGKLVH